MTLPMDMKKLEERLGAIIQEPSQRGKDQPYPNVAPEPSMYCPSVLMMPFGPAPYLKMLTVPKLDVRPAGLSQIRVAGGSHQR